MNKKKEPIHKLTLDEYDELTLHNQRLGAATERRDIEAHLRGVIAQVRGLQSLTSKESFKNELEAAEEGILIALNSIKYLPEYKDRAGCPECGSI